MMLERTQIEMIRLAPCDEQILPGDILIYNYERKCFSKYQGISVLELPYGKAKSSIDAHDEVMYIEAQVTRAVEMNEREVEIENFNRLMKKIEKKGKSEQEESSLDEEN